MEANVNVTLINEQGWQKQYQLNEGVHWVGSAANAQIQIVDAKEVAPYHLQIVNNKAEASIRLLNLSKEEIVLQKAGKQSHLEADGFTDVFGEVTLFLGGYTLKFSIDKEVQKKEAVLEHQQKVMGVRLVLSDVVLRPDAGPLIGTLSLQNLGDEPCQFEVHLEGLPPDCYEILPPPLIYAGGEESTEIRIFHRHVSPPAGRQTLTLRVSAPAVYPGKEIRVEQVIKVLSYYEHSLTFLTPTAKQVELIPVKPVAPQAAATSEEILPPSILPSEPTIPIFQMPIVQNQKFEQPGEQTVRIEGRQAEKQVVAAEMGPSGVPDIPLELVEPVPAFEEQKPDETVTIPVPEPPVGEAAHTFPMTEESAVPEAQVEAQPEQPAVELEAPVFRGVRKPSRPDLSSVKVMKASTGDFLQKKEGE